MLLGRIAIASLILFEFLNLAGILNFTLDFSWLGLLVTSVGTLLVLELLYYAFSPSPLAYLLVATGLWLDALGDVAHFYGNLDWYDQFMHVLGGGIVMAVTLAIFSKLGETKHLPVILILLLGLGLVALFGDLYEIEEYLEDRFYHERQVRLGTGPDTADDLMWNFLGGAAMGMLWVLVRRK